MSVYHWPNYLKIIIFTIIIGTMWLFNGPFVTPIFMGFFFAVLTLPVFELLQKNWVVTARDLQTEWLPL